MSIPIYWPDEFAFLKYNDIIFKSAGPAISKVSEIAEAHGRPHGRIISTTPSNIDNPAGAFCKGLIDNACVFVEEMYDWDRDILKDYIATNSSNDFLYISYTWKQLGLDEEWYKKECRVLNNDRAIIKREIDLQWTKSSDNSVFTEEQLDIIDSKKRTPIGIKYMDIKKVIKSTGEIRTFKFPIVLYEELKKEKVYFMGVDTAGGLDADNSAFTITDPEKDFAPVAVFKHNTIDINVYSSLIAQLVQEELPNCIVVPEFNSYGKGLVENLLDVIPKNIYYEYKLADKDKTANNPATKTDSIKYGITTDKASRPLMIDILKEIVADEPELLAIPELYDDVKGLIYKNGRIDHEVGMHDDVLFSYLFVKYVVRYGNNIGRFLRTRAKVAQNAKNFNAITRKVVDDPAVNKGQNHDFAELTQMILDGVPPDQLAKILGQKNNKVKGPQSSGIDTNLANMLAGKASADPLRHFRS
jgi:hypothetical protein